MRFVVRLAAFTMLAAGVVATFHYRAASAQIPDEFKNLEVLPKDIRKDELVQVMRSFSHALGLRCAGCHATTKEGSERLEDLDFASDDKREKRIAREMLQMVASINERIRQMDLESPNRVQCVTCHHGVQHPATLSMVMADAHTAGGLDSSVTRYRELRERYYGAAAYDFSPDALVEIGAARADQHRDFAGALALLRLNLEFNPQHVSTHIALGRVHAASGDTAASIASYEKALEIDPGNRWARQQLERVKGGK